MVMFFVAKICVRNPCLHLHDRDRRVYLPWDNSVLQEDTMAFLLSNRKKQFQHLQITMEVHWDNRMFGLFSCVCK